MNKFIHPAAQHLNRVAIAIATSHTSGRPTTYLVNNICRAFDGSQSVSEAVPEGVHHASLWSMITKPFVQSSAGRVGLVPLARTIIREGVFAVGVLDQRSLSCP